MGCLQSCFRSRAATRASAYQVKGESDENTKLAGDSSTPTAVVSSTPVAKLDPKDFMYTNQTGATLVKLPGQINGQQFVIDTCEDCDLYLLDHCAMVTIDDCKNCRIFVGPTDSSIFIRNSSNIKAAFLCRQLRVRDCRSCQILLHCRTRPIIETSQQMQFGCYDFSYPGLADQLAATKLSAFHNFWSHVYDYTPQTGLNWSFLAPSVTLPELLGALPDVPSSLASSEPAPAVAALLTTWGNRPLEAARPSLLAVLPAAKPAAALELVQTVTQQGGLLLRTNQIKLSKDAALQLAAKAGWPKPVAKALATGEWISLEFALDSPTAMAAAAVKLGGHAAVDAPDAAALLSSAGIEG